jgi:hypothetical protein
VCFIRKSYLKDKFKTDLEENGFEIILTNLSKDGLKRIDN